MSSGIWKCTMLLCFACNLIGYFTACSLFSGPEDALSEQERLLVGPTWKLVAVFVTYYEIWYEEDSTGFESIVKFYEDGRFMKDVVGGCCTQVGNWSFSEDMQELNPALHGQQQSGSNLGSGREGRVQRRVQLSGT